MFKNKKRVIIFAIIFLILIITPVSLNRYYNFQLEAVSKESQQFQIFVVRPGDSVTQIAQNLKREHLIKNAFFFRLLVGRIGISQNIQAGDFRLSAAMSSRQIAQELTHGAIDVWITLPEGTRVEEQAQLIEEKLKFAANELFQFDKSEYIKIAQEGYMFPDTYLIPKDATAQQVSQTLRQTFDQKVDKATLEDTSVSPLTTDEIITLASLIEREARTSQEKSIIAGILTNRLNSGIALQVDATVQYAKGYDTKAKTWWGTVTTADYKSVKSPYNTYLNSTLPPSPIASPGLQSIQAATNPAQTDYLYYLHDPKGNIHYAKTIEEHNQNIQEFL